MSHLPSRAACLALLGLIPLGLHSPDAHAGAIGVMGTAGLHDARAYYYRDDGEQGVDVQSRPNVGGGLEILLGDKDDKIQGLGRMYLLSDWPVNDPDLSNEDQSYDYVYPPASEQGHHNAGVMAVGIQWGLFGDPSGFQLLLTTLGGAGFATIDNLEFAMFEVGIGGAYTIADRIQPYLEVAFQGRFRKRLYTSEDAYIGVRYLFD